MMNEKISIVIIDYNQGNLYSIQNALKHIGYTSVITSNKSEIINADAVILPGVGAFGEAMDNLKKSDLISPIKEYINSGKSFLGICLGFQLLFTESFEFGRHSGMNIIEGEVVKFDNKSRRIKVPHVGWNTVYFKQQLGWSNSPMMQLSNYSYMYFVHSYYVKPADDSLIISYTEYEDIEFCSSLKICNLFGTQFHPEKSGKDGINIYKTFVNNLMLNKNE